MAQVLLVEDDRDQLEVRKLLLEREGHAVVTAMTTEEALRHAKERQVDLVLMDLRLPTAEDGLRLIRALREHDAQLRILVMSGWTEDLMKAPEAAMIDKCLRKPARSAQIIGAVRSLSRASGG
jgi:Response regulator containing CheY-like receiver, AAA-type ATPase, and DNA-binding domains